MRFTNEENRVRMQEISNTEALRRKKTMNLVIGKKVFVRSSLNKENKVNYDLMFDPMVKGFAGHEKICIREKNGVWTVTYIFGVALLANDPFEIDARLHEDGWQIGASNIVGKECVSALEVIRCVAYKEAYFKAYCKFSKKNKNVEEFIKEVRAGYTAEMEEFQKSFPTITSWIEDELKIINQKTEGLDKDSLIKLKNILTKIKFSELPSIRVGAGLSE